MKKIFALMAATMMAASMSFAQEDDQAWPQDETQEEVQSDSDESVATEETEPQETAQAEVKSSAPASVQEDSNIQSASQDDTESNTPIDTPPARKSSESRVGVGAKVAFDYGMMYGFKDGAENDSDIDSDPSGIGFEAGLMIRIQMISNLYFVPEVNFSYISTSHKVTELERTYSSMNLEIPLLVRGVVADKFYVTAGPQFTLKISDDTEIETRAIKLGDMDFKVDGFEEKIEQGSMDFGIAAGLGYNIVEGLNVDFRIYMGLMELFPDVTYLFSDDVTNVNDVDGNFSIIDLSGAKMMKFKVGISYWFM